jgi:hypothetical protein
MPKSALVSTSVFLSLKHVFWSKSGQVLLFCCGDESTCQKSTHPKLIEIYEHKLVNQIDIPAEILMNT